jgi:uroporphyrinogen-III decarboxylase
MYDLMDNPELVHAVMEKGVEFAVEKGKFNLDMGINILRLNDSVGNMNVISPAQWKEFVFPYIKEVCGQLHEYNPNARIYSHICGNILPVAELLVQTGLDCIGCMDPLGGTTCEKMRDIVGEDVALLGGINPLSFVAGEPQDIIDETRECISAAGKKGRYVISSGCVLPRSSKIENIRALNTAVSKYGIYK